MVINMIVDTAGLQEELVELIKDNKLAPVVSVDFYIHPQHNIIGIKTSEDKIYTISYMFPQIPDDCKEDTKYSIRKSVLLKSLQALIEPVFDEIVTVVVGIEPQKKRSLVKRIESIETILHNLQDYLSNLKRKIVEL